MAAEPPASPAGDADFLDRTFERAVALIEAGSDPAPEDLLEGREHLRSDVDALLRMARQVTPVHHDRLPVLPGFTILAAIGRGGMGTVYLARQESLGGRQVAIKVLPSSASLSAGARQRFLAEARAIAGLQHPNVVTVHEVLSGDGIDAYAMEWVDGGSLAELIDHLKAGPSGISSRGSVPGMPAMAAVRGFLGMPLPDPADTYPVYICRIGIAIARALQALHAAGLVHRDVKPSNILLRRDGTPLLSDFGLAHAIDDGLSQRGLFAGTILYASPEQLGGDPECLDARSDVYSLGVTLYQALTLHLPFDDVRGPARRVPTPAAMMRRIERGRAVPLRVWNRRLPRDIETIVAKATDPDPARRYPTTADLADDLERLLNLLPVHARPAGLLSRTAKLFRRHRAAALGLAAGSLVSLALAAAVLIYVLVVPQWVAGHLRDARLALLDPKQANAIYNTVFFGVPSRDASRLSGVSLEALDAALGHYDSAARWAPSDDGLRRERDLVASVRSTAQPTGAGAGADPQDIEALDPPALRLAGLRAFLRGDIDAAVRAWSRFEERQDAIHSPDPFVSASLGLLHLINDHPARAYPRLRDAVQTLPEIGFLSVYLAEAALRCGDLSEARRLLGRAHRQDRHDSFSSLSRVEADLAAAEGRPDEAERLYRQDPANPVGRFHLARLLDSSERPEEAITHYRQICRAVPRGRKPREALISAADRWWASLLADERWRRIRGALHESPWAADAFVSLLRDYASARRAAEPASSRASATEPFPALRIVTGSVRSAFFRLCPTLLAGFSSDAVQDIPLNALAQRLEVADVTHWNTIVAYPAALKELQILAWQSPWSRIFSIWIAAFAGVASTASTADAQTIVDLQFNVDGVLPTSDPAIKFFNNGSHPVFPESDFFSVSGGVLRQRSFGVSNTYPFYGLPTCPASFGVTSPIDPSKTTLLEFRVKVVRIEGDFGVRAEFYDGHYYTVSLDATGVWVVVNASFTREHVALNVFDYHIYRLEADGGTDTYRLFVDGVLVVANTAPLLPVYQGFGFGDDSGHAGQSGDADWDFVRLWQCPGVAPVAVAGNDQSVAEAAPVILDGTASIGLCGQPAFYLWSQLAGPPVTLDLLDPLHPDFIAPMVPAGGATLTFQLIVTDGQVSSDPDVVNITITNVNHLPVALAGGDQLVAEGGAVILDGSNSFDQDDEALTFTWNQIGVPAVVLDVINPAKPTFTAPLVGSGGAILTFELTVSDGTAAATDTVNVTVENVNHEPVADAGPDQTRAEGVLVTLDGSASLDPDADSLGFAWVQVSGPLVTLAGGNTATPGFTAPEVGPGGATLVFLLTVDDGSGGTVDDEVSITVQDGNAPPVCGLARPSVAELWPPNHKMVPVTITGVTDPENNAIVITITGVTQDEPVNGLGDGDTGPDAVLQGGTVLLRAERAGGGNGRVYRVSFEASDGQGGACTGQVSVCVPPSKGRNVPPCVDDGQTVNSLGP